MVQETKDPIYGISVIFYAYNIIYSQSCFNNMYSIYIHLCNISLCKEYLKLAISEVVCQSSPHQTRASMLPSCSPHDHLMALSLHKPPHCPLPSDNYSTSVHFSQWEPLTSDHVTELYNSYIVAKLFQLLPPLQIPVTWPVSHDQMTESSIYIRSPLLLHQGLPLGYLSRPRIW